ncbi:hypothetical protein P378_07125 [Desulforamulus profundi]|uniref:Uncharacterized protein n=1 Tax=Desulforamulus profundi TaxID=1383067 RepID=A0A2C6LJX1_9FIRM|nr:hypothetical protein [Desulforamulus profundi]PHJ38860.1 hypothetical protein P378_07125 [Desulforamulus profundi]
MELAKWINLIFAVIAWGAVLLLVKPQRIKELLPVGLLAAIVLLAGNLAFSTLGLWA